MNMRYSLFAALAVTIAASFAVPEANAADVLRSRAHRQMGAGSCEPFVPTTQVRYNASGLRNAGTSSIYVVCSLLGPESNNGEGVSELGVTMRNTSTVAQTATCSARAYHNGAQLASSKTKTAAPGEAISLNWFSSEFGISDLDRLGVPSFTCAVGPGMTLESTQMLYQELVGL